MGDFNPSLIKSRDAEVAIKRYKKGDYEAPHTHRLADEITIVISGMARINNVNLCEDSIAFIKAGESAEFFALTDVVTCVIKSPSVQGDKYPV